MGQTWTDWTLLVLGNLITFGLKESQMYCQVTLNASLSSDGHFIIKAVTFGDIELITVTNDFLTEHGEH